MVDAGEGELKLEHTPTWIVAAVCSVIVSISFLVERGLHLLGKELKKKKQKALFEALLKVKEELMLLGFISLMLVVSQGPIQRICISERLTHRLLPCDHGGARHGRRMRLLSAGEEGSGECRKKGKVPLLSPEALHELHIFIFVLAVTHVIISALTMLLGGAKIHQWKSWEDAIQKGDTGDVPRRFTHVHQVDFIKERFMGIDEDSSVLSWLHSFVKQFYGSVTRSDYTTMRLGFIMRQCRGNPKFNFHKYMVRALEGDFKKVVGISWYLWIFVVIFLLLNVHGWHAYFWISFIPLTLLLVVGTKLEHIINQLAHDVAEKHVAIEGNLVVNPSDDHFWFHRPRIILHLIHFILFQNAFEISFFFWILTTYGFSSCIMGHVGFIIPRLVISVVIQVLCSYSTLPLYAIVTQMGSSFKKAIFEEHVQEGLVSWAQKVKRRKGRITASEDGGSNSVGFENHSSAGIELHNLIVRNDSHLEQAIHDPVGGAGSTS